MKPRREGGYDSDGVFHDKSEDISRAALGIIPTDETTGIEMHFHVVPCGDRWQIIVSQRFGMSYQEYPGGPPQSLEDAIAFMDFIVNHPEAY